jgi:excisionase family DNA binding protein
MSDLVMDAREVATLLGVGYDYVLSEARADRIPHVRVGRKVKFRRQSIELWLAEIERGPVPSGSKPDAKSGGER